MVRAHKPTWIKRGQRATLAELSTSAASLMMDYERLASTIYIWEGLKEIGLTKRYLESVLFWNVAVGITEGNYVMGANIVVPDVTGEPYEWIPVATNITKLPTNIIRKYRTEQYPCMKVNNITTADSIADECVLEASAYVSAGQNTIAMRTPIVVSGVDGSAEINYIKDGLTEGASYIPYLGKVKDGGGFGIEVLDMKTANYLDPLTGFAEFVHSKILAKIGIDALGSQKASGITSEEAVLILAQIRGIREDGLEIREALCDMINEHIQGANVSVRVRDIYMAVNNDEQTAGDTMGNDTRNDNSSTQKSEV